jgi:hypothetical protein
MLEHGSGRINKGRERQRQDTLNRLSSRGYEFLLIRWAFGKIPAPQESFLRHRNNGKGKEAGKELIGMG